MANWGNALGFTFAVTWASLLRPDGAFLDIVWLSLQVSFSAAAAAALVGLPLGAMLAITRFRGRSLAILLANALLGLPPVLVGLLLYLLLSRSGSRGSSLA